MDGSPQDVLAAANNAWDMLVALAVAYSFSVIGAVVILVAGWLVAGLAERAVNQAMKATHHIDETIRAFVSKLVRYAILVLVFVTVLSQFGVQTTSIIAALGAAGLAIGLALQGTLQNIAAGLMLLFLRPFRVGEYIETSAASGTVREIGLFATELEMQDGVYVMAPNSSLWNTPVRNFTRNASRRHEFTISIAADADLEKAQSVIRAMLEEEPQVVANPAPTILVGDVSASSRSLTARYWSASRTLDDTRFAINEALEKALREKAIALL